MTIAWGLAILLLLFAMREQVRRGAGGAWLQLRAELGERRVALGWVAAAGLSAIALAYIAWQPFDLLVGLGLRVLNDTAWFLAWVATPLLALMAVAVVQEQLAGAIRAGCRIAGDALGDVATGFGRAREAALGYWREKVATDFHALAFLFGLLLLGIIPLLAWVQFALLVPTLESLLPVSDGAFEIHIAGHKLVPAQGVAMSIIVLEALAGLIYCELVGLTEMAPVFTRRLGRWSKAVLKSGSLLTLGALCCVEAELTAWRTIQLQRMDEMARTADDAFALGGVVPAETPAIAPDAPGKGALETLVDRMVPVTMIALGAIVPLGAAVAGIGIYHTLSGVHGAITAMAVLLPLTLLQGASVLLSRFAGYVATFLEAVLRVVAGLGDLVYNVIGWLWRRIREAGRDIRAAGTQGVEREAPAAAAAPTTSQQESHHANQPHPELTSMEDVLQRAYVDDNPLGVPDDDLALTGMGRRG